MENILFGLEFKPARFSKVLNACQLSNEISQLHDGHDTVIGQDGVYLSENFKIRLALARALYMKADIYLIDDILKSLE